MIVREANSADLGKICEIAEAAFGRQEGPVIVNLIKDLLDDPSAEPRMSLVALNDEEIVGHILFTKAVILQVPQVKVVNLAPLAVIPKRQKQGIGGLLISMGLAMLKKREVQMVFVLGHPEYYPRYGFQPAGGQGLDAPYPIPVQVAGAWMVQALTPGLLGTVRGTVRCADQLSKPEYWQE